MRSMSIYYSVLVLYVSRLAVWGESLVTQLREDRNLDLSEDVEYEDLRAELLAYHTAFASLAAAKRSDTIGPDEEEPAPQGRRSLGSTPCWQLGGICIDKELCPKGNRFLTEVNGCRDKFRVCCFTWNQYKLKDMSPLGFKNWALPWSVHHEVGGDGFIMPQGKQNVKETNEPERPGEESEEKQLNDINKSNSQENQRNEADDDNNEDWERRRRHHKRRKNRQPLAIIVET